MMAAPTAEALTTASVSPAHEGVFPEQRPHTVFGVPATEQFGAHRLRNEELGKQQRELWQQI
jgi:hypothetical protein